MVDCNKRQRELYKGEDRFRCVHPEATTKGEIVVESVCNACPLVKLKIKTCKEARETQVKQSYTPSEGYKPHALPVLNADAGYPTCPFRYNGEAGKTCSVTNLGVTSEICYRCDKLTKVHEKKNQAKMGTKVLNYFGAVRRWIASGMPTRTKEEIKSLFDEHCSKCDRYDKVKHACNSCGCPVSDDADPLDNKLAMKTESCPLGRF